MEPAVFEMLSESGREVLNIAVTFSRDVELRRAKHCANYNSGRARPGEGLPASIELWGGRLSAGATPPPAEPPPPPLELPRLNIKLVMVPSPITVRSCVPVIVRLPREVVSPFRL